MSPETAVKTRLFCPTCDHESPFDGDWLGDGPRLHCPRCGDCVVDRRPDHVTQAGSSRAD